MYLDRYIQCIIHRTKYKWKWYLNVLDTGLNFYVQTADVGWMRFWCWWKLPEKWRRLQMSSRWWSLGTSWSKHKPLIGQSQSILGSDWFWADDFLSIFCHLRHRPVWLGDHMSSYLGPGSLSRDGEGGRWSEETGRQVHDHMVANSRVLCVRCRSRPCLDQAILRSAKFTPRWNKTKYFRLRQSYEVRSES